MSIDPEARDQQEPPLTTTTPLAHRHSGGASQPPDTPVPAREVATGAVRLDLASRLAWIMLPTVLLAGLLLRIAILAGPFGEVEADESVVGLMALHVLAGEHYAFYWGQPFLGSLEAYLVALAFAALGPSNLVLKIVPGLVFFSFAVLVYLGARRDFGERVGLWTLLFLAVPPSFLALWSLKARGGYLELLALGQALLFMTPWVARGGPLIGLKVGAVGLLSGVLLWIHLLGLVYVVPTAVYLTARLGRRLMGWPLIAALAGGTVGLAPALVYNLQNDWETIRAAGAGGATLDTLRSNLQSLLTIGLPVMVGLGQPTSSPILFAEDWPHRPGSWPWVPPLLLGLLLLALLPSLPALMAPARGPRGERQARAFLGLGILLLGPPLASLGRFGDLVAEPRYALPLYSAVPVFAAGIAAFGGRRRLAGLAAGLAVFGAVMYSLLTADPRLGLPTTAGASTEQNRAELLGFLESRGLTEIYADYWLAYPLIFESRERVAASVSGGGYNRFASYSYYVSTSERPAFVFVSDSPEQAAFEQTVREVGGKARMELVSIYSVYYDAQPLELLRPP